MEISQGSAALAHAGAEPVRPLALAGKIKRAKAVAAITIGNGLEYFEFTSYSFFAIIIGKLYFPATGDIAQLLLVTATFGIGFVARPVGGLLLGAYADRAGRKAAMTLTLQLMALGSAMIVFAPTYAQIGLAAPALIVAARLIQGFALGGEIGASTSLLMEYADDRSRGFYGGLQAVSQNLSALLGALTGLLLTAILTTPSLESWGWRIPFAIGLLMGPLGVFIRRNLHETLDDGPAGAGKQTHGGVIRSVFAQHKKQIVAGILLTMGSTAAIYITLYYIPTYATKILHMSMSAGLAAACVAAAVAAVVAPLAGKLSDRVGRKAVFGAFCMLLVLVIYPAFAIINAHPSLNALLPIIALLSFLTTFIAVPSLVMLPEMFPRPVRVTGMSVVYCVGVSIFGGFAPFFATELMALSGSNLAPSWYVIGCAVIALLSLPLIQDKAGLPLD
ncbi:Permeases of the major facilitator superfamily [Collimonas arenae]|uniref:Permeases of the major facilitator superfamily n=1 Tax=Collimonas arenae TaxID=279058 RepID=A0A0A1FCB7_9BURK|nr:MFS transporter [Collimonas arenae]AIY41415.1 Permeases of the major facilitator superfamily [Collimonas arenae]